MPPSSKWEIGGRFLIAADTREEAERAMVAIERTAARVSASVDMHVHVSEAVERDA